MFVPLRLRAFVTPCLRRTVRREGPTAVKWPRLNGRRVSSIEVEFAERRPRLAQGGPSRPGPALGGQQVRQANVTVLVVGLSVDRPLHQADRVVYFALGLGAGGQEVEQFQVSQPDPLPGLAGPGLITVGGQQLAVVPGEGGEPDCCRPVALSG